MPAEPTHFITVDLDLFGPEPLHPLLEAWGDEVFVLHHDPFPGRGWHAGLEVGMHRTPQRNIRHFVRLVQRLSPPLRARWDRLTERTLDVGVQSGAAGPHAWHFDLSRKTLLEIAEIGARLACTVYSPVDGEVPWWERPARTHRAIKRARQRR